MNVAVLLSGGVDSSLALALLQREKRLALKAYYLKIWLEDELFSPGDCPWETDLTYARATCEQLGVPLEIVPLQSEYRDHIVEYALAELRLGRTPSPDIWCNQRVKFGGLLSAGGQRVRANCLPGTTPASRRTRTVINSGAPPIRLKDQTYFLSNLNQAQLARLCLPIGHLHKHQVRALAAEFDLPTKDRPDSQGMCFLGKINYRDFVRFHLGEARGDIVEQASGQKKGEHPGYWFYTIGQRHGLQLGGGPWYVIDKDVANNIVYIAHGSAPTRTGSRELIAKQIHWIAGAPEARRTPRQAPARASPSTLSGANARARSRPCRPSHARSRHCSGPARRVLRR